VTSALPEGLSAARHRDLAGRSADPWIRRLLLAGLAGIVLLALLGVFGQQPETSRAASADASLVVQAPSRIRGGLIFQARFTITAGRRLEQPVLSLERGWFENMSINSVAPEPTSETSRGDHVDLVFDALGAGETMTVWIYFQANPTNLGRQRERVALRDGATTLVHLDRSVLIFP
jgi:hypothetical protein